jgi:hypothetical protein
MSNQNKAETKKRHNSDPSKEKKQQKAKKRSKGGTSEKSLTREDRKKVKKPRIRLVPIWLRLFIILILLAGCLAAGAAVGYGIIGEGEVTDIFNKETWQHIIDIVKQEA